MADPTLLIHQPPSDPMIRTMKSDVEAFLKTSKPSLVSILAEQTARDAPYTVTLPPRRVSWIMLAASLGVGAIASLAAVWYLNRTPAKTPQQTTATTPAPFFFYEHVSELAIPRSRKDLASALTRTNNAAHPIGSFERLVIRAADAANGNPLLSVSDVFSILNIASPNTFLDSLLEEPQFFIYHERTGPRFGMIVASKNPQRTLQSLFSWEPSMQSSFAPFFLGTPPQPTLKPFVDSTYRNTDYRYLALDPEHDLGIGYLQFAARHLIVITTSEESLQLVLTRLFENR